jgi:hypothetical protein
LKFRFSSVDENVDYLDEMRLTLASLAPDAILFVTLSPVPLIGVPKHLSVLERDVVSKSILRLSIEKMRERDNIHYWPSFELVKWLPGHLTGIMNYQSFGDPDNNSRHVSRWLVNLIVETFCDEVVDQV